MAFLSQGGSTSQQPNYVGLAIPTSVNVLPIPVMWGNRRLGPNLIQYEDFTKTDTNNQGGSGFGSSPNYDYHATLVMALCEGPVSEVGQTYIDSQTVTTLYGAGFSETLGYNPQPPWSFLLAEHPDRALGYNGTAYVMQGLVDLGSSPNAPMYGFQVYGDTSFFAAWSSQNFDADPALVIQDFLTNQQYGVVGFPSAMIDTSTLLSSAPVSGVVTDGTLETYCAAVDLAISPLCDSAERAQSILARWLQLVNCTAVWSGPKLKFVPYGDLPITRVGANGTTYSFVPNLTTEYDLTDDDFVGDAKADPVTVTRSDTADAYNIVRIEATNLETNYGYIPIEARDQNAIETSGLGERIAPTLTAHEFTNLAAARLSAQLILQRGLFERKTSKFKLSWEFCLLEAMDLVRIPDQTTGAWITVRITKVEEDERGELSFEAEEFIQGVGTASPYAVQATSATVPNPALDADPVNVPVILEPSNLLVSIPQVWMAVSGGAGGISDPTWGGADVYISFDDITYTRVGQITAPARQGVLTATLAAPPGANPDTTNTLYVDLTESAGILISGTTADAAAGRTLCYVDGELLAFATAGLVGATATAEANTVPATAPYLIAVTESKFWTADGGVAYAAGGSLTATASIAVSGEAHSVPASAGYQVTVTHAPFVADAGVGYAAGGTLTAVAGNPSTGQYVSIGNGNYQFAPGDAGVAMKISYSYANPAAAHYTAYAGLYWFNAADGGVAVKITYTYDSPYHYALTYLERGLYGTVAASHAGGTQFARLDQAVFQYNLPTQYVGTEIWLKFPSFNIFGKGNQSLADAVAYPYTPNGAGIAPALAYLLNGDTAPSGVIVDQSGIAVQVNTAR